jgi:hypothetical protein
MVAPGGDATCPVILPQTSRSFAGRRRVDPRHGASVERAIA